MILLCSRQEVDDDEQSWFERVSSRSERNKMRVGRRRRREGIREVEDGEGKPPLSRVAAAVVEKKRKQGEGPRRIRIRERKREVGEGRPPPLVRVEKMNSVRLPENE
uniref:Uncharacterized protein n=1 Tax=Nelumbo nucifera TaxID=4432 RepID=A0A822YYV7_NELNU|nr:TPA_asm: hypothetical protein HUJ06_013607 [Nelumbo nucifera]